MLKITKQSDPLVRENTIVMIYGYPGLGKTSLAQTADSVLTLDFDQGIERAVTRADTLQVNAWDEIVQLMKQPELIRGYKTIVIDTVGTALDDFLAGYVMRKEPKNKKAGGGLALAGYGAMKDEFKVFYDWLKQWKLNLVLIAHLTEKGDAEDIQLRPKITGGTYDMIISKCDQMGYMTVVNDQRTVSFRPVRNAVAKDAGELGNIEVPLNTDPNYADFLQVAVIDATLSKINSRSEKAREYQEFINFQADEIKDLESVDEVNDKMLETVEMEQPKGIVTQVKKHLLSRAKELEFEFDKETAQFVDPKAKKKGKAAADKKEESKSEDKVDENDQAESK